MPIHFGTDGWRAVISDSFTFSNLRMVSQAIAESLASGKPGAIVCNTVKGKGVPFMEDDNNWHYRIPTAEEVERARVELGV